MPEQSNLSIKKCQNHNIRMTIHSSSQDCDMPKKFNSTSKNNVLFKIQFNARGWHSIKWLPKILRDFLPSFSPFRNWAEPIYFKMSIRNASRYLLIGELYQEESLSKFENQNHWRRIFLSLRIQASVWSNELREALEVHHIKNCSKEELFLVRKSENRDVSEN
jgi:hypothetical protein